MPAVAAILQEIAGRPQTRTRRRPARIASTPHVFARSAIRPLASLRTAARLPAFAASVPDLLAHDGQHHGTAPPAAEPSPCAPWPQQGQAHGDIDRASETPLSEFPASYMI